LLAQLFMGSVGYSKHFYGRQDRSDPYVITIFSAPNYCDTYGNQAAFINYEGPKYTFVQTVAQPHPYVLPGFQNALSYTMPFVSEHCKPMHDPCRLSHVPGVKFWATLIGICTADVDSPDEVDEAIKKKLTFMMKALVLMSESRQARQSEMPRSEASDHFDAALAADGRNERQPHQKRRAGRPQLVRQQSSYF
jgi:hypothetical protein